MSSSGSVVKIDSGVADDVDAGWVDGRNLIIEKFEQQESLVLQMREDETAALEALKEQLEESSLPLGWADDLDNVVIDPLTLIERETGGSMPVLTLPDGWPTNLPILDVLKEAPDVDLNYDKPVKPNAPTIDFNYQEQNYDSVIWMPLYTAILNGINNGGTSFSTEIQALLLTQGIERQKVIRDKAYQQSIDAIGADGFDLAGGAESSLIGWTINTAATEDSSLNRDVTLKMAELTDLNTRFMLDKGAVLEQLARDYHNNRENRTLEAEKAFTGFVLTQYSELMKAYVSEWDGIKVELESKVAAVEVILKENQLTISGFLGRMDGAKVQTEIVSSQTSSAVEGYKGEIEGFKAKLQERSDWWSALTAEQKNKISRDELVLKKAVDKVNTILNGTLSDNELKMKITDAIASIVAQVLASALASVNTGITHSTGKSESISESYGHTDHLSESYPHTPID